jgi:hypothetical protein
MQRSGSPVTSPVTAVSNGRWALQNLNPVLPVLDSGFLSHHYRVCNTVDVHVSTEYMHNTLGTYFAGENILHLLPNFSTLNGQ